MLKNDPSTNKDIKEEKIKTSIFFVEANSFEELCLWREYSQEVVWEQDTAGFCQIIGFIGNRKKKRIVNVSFSFAVINGQLICFYDPISRFVDHKMVEKFLDKYYPVKYDNNSRRAITDAMNFGDVLTAIREKNMKAQKI